MEKDRTEQDVKLVSIPARLSTEYVCSEVILAHPCLNGVYHQERMITSE